MKTGVHPSNFRPVVFEDISNGAQFLIWSTIATTKKTKFEGAEYDMYEVEISSTSHPFYTGETKIMDTAGRVDKFKARAARAAKK